MAKRNKINGKNGVSGINRRSRGFASVKQILAWFDPVKDKYITREFQKFGYGLAVALNDLKHKSLYIKLAKETSRTLLEKALAYVKDAVEVKSKAKLFMWKLKALQEGKEEKKADLQKGRF